MPTHKNVTKYPPLPSTTLKLLSKAIQKPLPLQEYTTHRNTIARTAKVDYLGEQEDVHSITLTPNQFDYSFKMEVDINHNNDLGFDLVTHEEKPLQINNCRKGTIAAKVTHW